MSYIPNDLMKQAIEEKCELSIKSCLKGIIYSDRSFSNNEFDDALEYIKSSGVNLYKAYDGKELLFNEAKKSALTDDDFTKAVFLLTENFCEERIRDLKNIAKIVYPIKLDSQSIIKTEKSKYNYNAESKVNKKVIAFISVVVIIGAIALLKSLE